MMLSYNVYFTEIKNQRNVFINIYIYIYVLSKNLNFTQIYQKKINIMSDEFL